MRSLQAPQRHLTRGHSWSLSDGPAWAALEEVSRKDRIVSAAPNWNRRSRCLLAGGINVDSVMPPTARIIQNGARLYVIGDRQVLGRDASCSSIRVAIHPGNDQLLEDTDRAQSMLRLQDCFQLVQLAPVIFFKIEAFWWRESQYRLGGRNRCPGESILPVESAKLYHSGGVEARARKTICNLTTSFLGPQDGQKAIIC